MTDHPFYEYEDLPYLAIELPEDVKAYKYQGDFTGEMRCIEKLLKNPMLSPSMVRRLRVEYAIADVMGHDYSMTWDVLLEHLKKSYPGLESSALDAIMATGHADYILRGGVPYFQDDACANILNECGDTLRALTEPGFVPAPHINETRRAMIAEMKEKGVLSRRFRIKAWIRPDEKQFAHRAGDTIRVHLPIPAECETQSDIRILATSHPAVISDGDQRTAYIETSYKPGDTYWVEFSYVNTAKYHTPDPVIAAETEQPKFYLDEEYPHIRFTPYMRALAKEIAGDETNPLLLAHRVYDYITSQIRYSYMRSYFALENIPEFAVREGRGDCGVQALVFITICRILGIPARWQSGHGIYGNYVGSHDWAQFYIAPYGWLYADPSYGGSAYCGGDDIVRNHYFGNLDPNRHVTCNEFQKQFIPAKRFPRMDPYDNQNGEIEFEDFGLTGSEIECGHELLENEALN
ncbi:MAG: transglutaminase-like domain-containing protein [Clostridia bacterium]|nr:transglutaminase-like domain-containing protein [Clostridia bacterium]